MGWRPLSRRGGGDDGYAGPFEGVPEWLFGPLWTWCTRRMPLQGDGSLRYGAVAEYRRAAMALRISLDDPANPNPRDARGLQGALLYEVNGNRDLLLDLADYLVAQFTRVRYGPNLDAHLAELEGMLREAGSVWTLDVTGEVPALVRRVDEVEAAQAQAAMESGRAGELLAQAWRSIYGRSPDSAGAYRDAVRAVEAAGAPIVSPQNSRTTLGTMIADLRAKPEKWSVAVGAGLSQADRVSTVAQLMDLLWKGQHDRHGNPDPAAPLNVSPQEAEEAVHIAVLLVRWFTNATVTAAAPS